mmetsp:Transcript_9527/g.23702  ORF Transcript_9527/g.23702 Transcript_9527/m.23702 type:complete len:209 (+) Transcript_9527:709-1335(+)
MSSPLTFRDIRATRISVFTCVGQQQRGEKKEQARKGAHVRPSVRPSVSQSVGRIALSRVHRSAAVFPGMAGRNITGEVGSPDAFPPLCFALVGWLTPWPRLFLLSSSSPINWYLAPALKWHGVESETSTSSSHPSSSTTTVSTLTTAFSRPTVRTLSPSLHAPPGEPLAAHVFVQTMSCTDTGRPCFTDMLAARERETERCRSDAEPT